MQVLASLYGTNSKTGSAIVWEFCETASGRFCATNGTRIIPAATKDELRRTFTRMLGYKTKAGTLRFSREPVLQDTPVSA
jgi:hypothetical protein